MKMGRKERTSACTVESTSKKSRTNNKKEKKNQVGLKTKMKRNMEEIAGSATISNHSDLIDESNGGELAEQTISNLPSNSMANIQLAINQRPRRQIKHKYIKTNRSPVEQNVFKIDEVNKLTNCTRTLMTQQDSTESNSSTTDNSNQFSPLRKPTSPTKLKLNKKKIAQQEKIIQISLNEKNTEIQSPETTQKHDESQLVEIIDDINQDILEEVVETTSLTETDSNHYNYYFVEDSSQEANKSTISNSSDNATKDTTDSENKHTYLVTIEEGSSNSELSQNFSKQIYVEVTDSLDSQEMIEVVTTYESCSEQEINTVDSQLDVNKPMLAVKNIRNSFEGVLNEISQKNNIDDVQKIDSTETNSENSNTICSQPSIEPMENIEKSNAACLIKKPTRFIPCRRMTRSSSLAVNLRDELYDKNKPIEMSTETKDNIIKSKQLSYIDGIKNEIIEKAKTIYPTSAINLAKESNVKHIETIALGECSFSSTNSQINIITSDNRSQVFEQKSKNLSELNKNISQKIEYMELILDDNKSTVKSRKQFHKLASTPYEKSTASEVVTDLVASNLVTSTDLMPSTDSLVSKTKVASGESKALTETITSAVSQVLTESIPSIVSTASTASETSIPLIESIVPIVSTGSILSATSVVSIPSIISIAPAASVVSTPSVELIVSGATVVSAAPGATITSEASIDLETSVAPVVLVAKEQSGVALEVPQVPEILEALIASETSIAPEVSITPEATIAPKAPAALEGPVMSSVSFTSTILAESVLSYISPSKKKTKAAKFDINTLNNAVELSNTKKSAHVTKAIIVADDSSNSSMSIISSPIVANKPKRRGRKSAQVNVEDIVASNELIKTPVQIEQKTAAKKTEKMPEFISITEQCLIEKHEPELLDKYLTSNIPVSVQMSDNKNYETFKITQEMSTTTTNTSATATNAPILNGCVFEINSNADKFDKDKKITTSKICEQKSGKGLKSSGEKVRKTKDNNKQKLENTSIENEQSETIICTNMPIKDKKKNKKDQKKIIVTSTTDALGKTNLTAEQELALDLLRQLEQSGKQHRKPNCLNKNQQPLLPNPIMPETPFRVRTAAEKKEMKDVFKEKPKKLPRNCNGENKKSSDSKKTAKKSKKINNKKLLENNTKKISNELQAATDDKTKLSTGKKHQRTSGKLEYPLSSDCEANKPSYERANSYSILSECYLPKFFKCDESLYSIEALKAAQLAAEKIDKEPYPVIPEKTYTTHPQKSIQAVVKKTDLIEDKVEIDENSQSTDDSNAIDLNESVNSGIKCESADIKCNFTGKENLKNSSIDNKLKQNNSSNEDEISIRRSGRLKTKIESNQRSHGYGLVKDKDRFLCSTDYGVSSLGTPTTTSIGLLQEHSNQYTLSDNSNSSSMIDLREEFMQYFELRLKTTDELEKEAKDMEDALSQFSQIIENEYKCERIISKEGRKMTCDCFLTKSEIERGELGCGEDCLNRLLMIECSNRCVVGERCTNKRFQKIQNADCAVVRTEKKGFGLKAISMIPAGEFIMEYVGEVLNSKQFEEKVETYCKVNNKHFYFMALRSDCIIDATSRGNISRFINHSCEPNAETQKWTVNGELRVGFFSKQNIYPDQEITFDYQFQRYGKEAQQCFCGAECCRGWIGEQPDSEEELLDEDAEEDDEDEMVEIEGEKIDKEHRTDILDNMMIVKTESTDNEMNKELDESMNTDLLHKEKIDQSDGKMSPESVPIKLTKMVKLKKDKQLRTDKNMKKVKRPDITDDLDLDQEIFSLTKTNLKNQAHTLQFSRLMVRAKQPKSKSQLLQILRNGELACRRLFLDYHGLKLLYTWMCDAVSTDMKIEWEFRIEIMETLEVLPIPNKTMLQDSKVLATITKWNNLKEITKSPDESPNDSGSTTPILDCNASPKTEEQSIVDDNGKQNEIYVNAELIHRIKRYASKLLSAWESLTEVFRIPKKLRIEQMKEHEREADLSYEASRNIQDEERKNRNYKSKERDGDRDKSWDRDRYKHKEHHDGESTLTKQQRRQLFEAKVAHEIEMEKKRTEEEIEHAARCAFFRLDPRTTNRFVVPLCVDPTIGQWYSAYNQTIPTPPSHAHIKPPPKKQSTNLDDYDIKPMDLPEFWKYAIDDQGRMYYYHVKIRIPQWEPPIKLLPLIEQQKTKDENTPTLDGGSGKSLDDQKHDQLLKLDIGAVDEDGDDDDNDDDNSSVISHDSSEDELETRLTQLKKFLMDSRTTLDTNLAEEINALASTSEASASETSWPDINNSISKTGFNLDHSIDSILPSSKKRREGLVQERIISPRTDEERIQLKQELKRYKENKEKLRKRKEEAKRRKSMQVLARKVSKITEGLPAVLSQDDVDIESDEDDSLPTIQSNEIETKVNDSIIISTDLEADDQPAPFKSLNKIFDELDVLKRQNNKSLKRNKSENSQSDSKRRKKNDTSHHTGHTNSEAAKRIKDKFRTEIAGVIVHHLSPYRKESCKIGRITTNNDFKHLAKKLTHFVMLKELKHCDNTINVLEVTDSVKQKSKEFIRKYMAKFGETYTKPDNEPEYRDFNSQ